MIGISLHPPEFSQKGKTMPPYLADLIVINYNSRRYLPGCLESLKKNSGSATDYRIWVVDNGSTDRSVSYLRTLPRISVIYNSKNTGYGAACNLGIQAGTGECIFLLNSDIVVNPGWLEPLIRILKSSPRVAVAGPKLINSRGFIMGAGVVGSNARPVIRGWGEPDGPEKYHQAMEVLSVCGACMGIKRALLSGLGLFDEHYFHYFEETDYCYNARFHGYKVMYCPESKVIHHGHGSCLDTAKLQKYYHDSNNYFQQKWAVFLKDETVYGDTVLNIPSPT